MTDIGMTSGVADAAADSGSGLDTQESAFSFQQDQGNTNGQGDQGNPAWKPILDVLPTSLHQTVMPVLQQWDKGVQEKFQQNAQAQSQYAPWQPLIDAGLDPDTILGLTQLIENDPRRLYDELANFHKWDQASGQDQSGQELNLDEIQDPNQGIDLESNPEYQQMKLQLQQLQGFAENTVQEKVQNQAMSQIETELAQVKEKNPNIIEPILLSLANTLELTVAEAAAKYDELMPKAASTAPTVLSPSGGVPVAPGTKPSQMTSQQRQAMVQQILQARASES